MNKHVSVIGAAIGLVSLAQAVPINMVAYASLTGTETITFDDVAGGGAPGTNYDAVFESGGANFGERFVGQTVSNSGGFDVVNGTPSGTLTVAVGTAGHNLNVFNHNGSHVLTGLGTAGFPDFNAIGEGSFSVLFDFDQSEFGFQLVGGDGGSATVDFYTRTGTLIESKTVSGLADSFYGFSRDGGLTDIAGLVIYNLDGGGIGFDNLRHDVANVPGDPNAAVPEPTTLALFGAGLLGLFASRKKFRKTQA